MRGRQKISVYILFLLAMGACSLVQAAGVAIAAPPAVQPKANVECFFFEGPGGYDFEIQTFLNPEIAVQF